MGTVVSFTADRMIEVENSSIVRGVIDMDGMLILTTRDGRDYNAGYIGLAGPHSHAIEDVTSLEDALSDSAGKVALVENTIQQLKDGTLRELEEAVLIAQQTADSTVKVHHEADLGPGVYPELNDTSDLGDLYYRLDGQVERWLGSGEGKGWILVEDTVLAETIAALQDAETQINILNTETLPALNADLATAQQTIADHTTDLGTLGGRLEDAEEDVTAAQGAINTLNTVTLPALDSRLEDAEVDIATAQSQVNTLNDVTLPALSTRLSDAEQDVINTQGEVDTLNNTTLPALDGRLEDAEGSVTTAQNAINTLNTVTLPALSGRLGDAETDISTAQGALNTLNDTTLPNLNDALAEKLPKTSASGTAAGDRQVIGHDVFSYAVGVRSSDNLVIWTKIKPATMMRASIKGYNYGGPQSELDVVVSCYRYTDTSILYPTYTNLGTAQTTVRFAQSPDGLVIILSAPSSDWHYTRLTIPEVTIAWSGAFESNLTEWSASLVPEADLAALVTGITISPASYSRDLNDTHSLTQGWRTTGTTTIDGGKITADSVTAGQIKANAITADELAANAVYAGSIQADAVTANAIAANAVTANAIKAGEVVAGKIAANAVTATTIAADAVEAAKIKAGAVVAGKIAADAVTATTIAADAVTASKIDADAVTARSIATDAVTADAIKANAVTATAIAAGAITAGKIFAGAIVAADIASNAIVADKIASNAITAVKIAADAVTATKLDADAVTARAIATDAVTADSIKAGEVTATAIASNAITAAKIAGGTITGDKIAGHTISANKLLVGDFENLIVDVAAETGSAEPHFAGANAASLSVQTTTPDANGVDPGTHLWVVRDTRDDGIFRTVILFAGTNGELYFPVKPGSKYRLSSKIRLGGNYTNGVGQNRWVIRELNSAGTSISYRGVGSAQSGSWTWDDFVAEIETSPTTVKMSVEIQSTAINAGLRIGWPAVRSMVGTLIEDGAITTEKVKANAITANEMKTGTITAASGILANAVITEAKIADLAVTNAKVSGLSATKITTDTLGADRIGARSIVAEKLVLGGVRNLFANGCRELGTMHNAPAGWSTYGGPSEIPGAFYIGTGVTGWQIFGGDSMAEIQSGVEYLLEVWLYSNLAGQSIAVAFDEYAPGGTTYLRRTYPVWPQNSPTGWTKYTASITPGANAVQALMQIVPNHSNGSVTNAATGFAVRLRPKSAGELIVDGAITTIKLDAEAVTASKIDSGAVTTAKLDAGAVTSEKITSADIINKSFKGSKFVLLDDQGGEYINFSPIDPILGNPAIAKFGQGANVVTIDDTGTVSGRQGVFDTVSFGGSSMEELLAKTALGVVARSDFGAFTDSDGYIPAERGLTELRFQTPPGGKREYRIIGSRLGVIASTSPETRIAVRMTTDGTRPTTSSPVMLVWQIDKHSIQTTHAVQREYAFDGDTDIRLLLTMSPVGGGYTGWEKNVGVEFSIIDEGPYIERTGVASNDESAPVNPIQTYTKEYASNWSRSYMGNNAPRSVEDGNLYQGQTPYWTAGGIQRSLFGFPTSLQSDLSGATIQKIEVYLRFAHWHNGAGGTAVIGTHAHTSRPSSFSHSSASVATVGGWGRGEGKWVTIPSSQYSAFAAGTRRGISLYVNSTSTAYYGYASPAARIRATYKK